MRRPEAAAEMFRRVLGIEADPEERGVHAAMLRFVGFRVLEAADAEAGGRVARGERPAVRRTSRILQPYPARGTFLRPSYVYSRQEERRRSG